MQRNHRISLIDRIMNSTETINTSFILKIGLMIFLVTQPLITSAQSGRTFKIEELSKPEKALRMESINQIYQKLILKGVEFNMYEFEKDEIDFPFNIIAKSQIRNDLVSFGYHSFFNGIYQAYADHRPFVLSPDMIWLLISQGFARHVINNSEELRKYFVDFDGKLTLTVRRDDIRLDNPESPWESVFPEFTKKIGAFTGKDLINTLTSDFTTSTPASRVASEITIMEAMKPYFEFVVFTVICGIPEITLEGTPEDWQKILEKAVFLRKYKLDWWIDEIEPILEEIVKTSKGQIKKSFWINMFKHHTEKKYGAETIDGWIVKFFPYDKDGKKNNLKKIIDRDKLPDEIVKADLKYITINDVTGETKETPLELWAGFIGLEQNTETFSLKPHIGWMIRKKDIEKRGMIEKLKSDNSSDGGGIFIRVKTIPKEIFELKRIKKLSIDFFDKIVIPDKISEIEIGELSISGSITEFEIERICKLLPETELIINNKPIPPKDRIKH